MKAASLCCVLCLLHLKNPSDLLSWYDLSFQSCVSMNFSSVLNDLHHGKHMFVLMYIFSAKYGEGDSPDEPAQGKLSHSLVLLIWLQIRFTGIATLFWWLILNSNVITHPWRAQMHHRLQFISHDPSHFPVFSSNFACLIIGCRITYWSWQIGASLLLRDNHTPVRTSHPGLCSGFPSPRS